MDLKSARDLKPAYFFNEFEFYRQKLSEHAPEYFEQLLLKIKGTKRAPKSLRDYLALLSTNS